MSGTQLSSAELDPRRRKILFRAWHRGMREMDLILGGFADSALTTLTDTQLDELEHIMDLPDRDLLQFITEEIPTPSNYATPLFAQIKAFAPQIDGL
jgi:antitoxin CptB